MIKYKRVYEQPEKSDGYRILIDRIWPRGLTKEKASIDLWMKEIAPSTELRKWFGHKEEHWTKFKERYEKELTEKDNLLKQIKTLEQTKKRVTLLYAAKDTMHNHAIVLITLLKEK